LCAIDFQLNITATDFYWESAYSVTRIGS